MLTDNGALVRVSRRHPCPICGKPDWCLVASDGSAAICPRVCEGSVKRVGEAGYLHILRDDPDWPRRARMRTIRVDLPDRSQRDFGPLAAEYAAAVEETKLEAFAECLGLSVDSLIRLGIGWSTQHGAWSFPMRGSDMNVRGIRLRSMTGRKWAVTGSRDGLFIPNGLCFTGPLCICEGPTDTAAMLALGFETVGRPSCTGGTKLLAELVRRKGPPALVIVADSDGPGERGAEALASTLLPLCGAVRLIHPPEGIKDARAWKRAGAARQDVQAAIDEAPVRKLQTVRRARA